MDSYRPVLAATGCRAPRERARKGKANHGYETRPCERNTYFQRRDGCSNASRAYKRVFVRIAASVLRPLAQLFGRAVDQPHQRARATAAHKICAAASSITPAASATAAGPRPQR